MAVIELAKAVARQVKNAPLPQATNPLNPNKLLLSKWSSTPHLFGCTSLNLTPRPFSPTLFTRAVKALVTLVTLLSCAAKEDPLSLNWFFINTKGT